MSKALSVKSEFIKPRFLDAINTEGLTAKDIAESLGVPVENVHKKIRRNWLEKDNPSIFKAIPYVILNENNGLTVETYALDTVSAKAFVARWKNEKGDSYLQFLFGCERLVMDELPKLLNRIKELEQNVKIALPIKKNHHLKNTSLVPVYQMGMFGDEIVEFRRVPISDDSFSDLSRIEGRITHLSQCMAGMATSIRNLMQKAIVERRK